MNTKSINVLGYTGNNSQFVVKTLNTNLRINQNTKYPVQEGPNPYEYLLAGFAGCINALGQLIAAEHNIALDSLQVEITGDLDTAKYDGPSKQRAGFSRIEVTLKPTTNSPLGILQKWIKEIQDRSPVYNNLVNNTSIDLVLYKEYNVS